MKGALIAVGVFAALLVMVLATREGGNVNVGVPRLALAAVDPAVVTSIELTGAQTTSLKKEPTGWTVAGAEKSFHAADDAQVRSALDQLKDLKAGDFVGERAEKLAELELDDAKGLRVKVFTSGAAPALEFILGKQAKNGGSYLRSPKTNQSFVTQSGLGFALRRDANGWRKRPFFPTTAAQLTKISVKDGEPLVVELAADKWTLTTPAPAGFRFDPAAAVRLSNTLAGVSAVDFLDAPATDPFAGPHPVIEMTRKEGAPLVLHLGAPVAAGVPARLDGDPQVYVVAANVAAALKPGLAAMRDTTLLAFEPAKATKLQITAAGKKLLLTKGAGGWTLVEPKSAPEFDAGQVAARLAELQSLRALSVADADEKQAGLAKATTLVEISLEGAPAQSLRLGGAASDGKIYAKGGADALVYLVDPAVRTRWDSGLALFKKPPAPPPGGMQGLDSLPPEIRKQLEAQLRQRGQMQQ